MDKKYNNKATFIINNWLDRYRELTSILATRLENNKES